MQPTLAIEKRNQPMQKKKLVLVIFMTAVLASVGTAFGALALRSQPQPNVPVASMLNDTGVVTAGTNYPIQSDGGGFYFNGITSVSSILQGSSGDWVLDTGSSTTRTILIDLRQPVPNSGAAPPFAWELLPARIISKCHEALAGSFPAMTLNQTLSCPTGIAFQYGGNSYGLMMTSGPNSDINYAETNNPLVTCTSVDGSNHCNKWTVLPIRQPDGTIKNIARLRKALKGNNNFAFLGDYYLSFNIEVTNP
jgi:hypothetical protein